MTPFARILILLASTVFLSSCGYLYKEQKQVVFTQQEMDFLAKKLLKQELGREPSVAAQELPAEETQIQSLLDSASAQAPAKARLDKKSSKNKTADARYENTASSQTIKEKEDRQPDQKRKSSKQSTDSYRCKKYNLCE